jgi:molybdate/tungstate transport system permease protein
MKTPIFIFLGGLIIFFIVYPLLQMFFSVTPTAFGVTLIDPEVIASIILTLKASLYATVAAIFLGVPLAYLLVRHEFRGKKLVEGIVDLPVIIPHSAAGIALLTVWGRNSAFGRATGLSILGTEVAICIAMFFVSVPLLVGTVKNGLKLIDPRYEKVAITLGASPMRAFFTVTLPMLRKSIISGSILMWARGISEFGAVIILAYHPMIAPILIFDRYETYGLEWARPVAVILILICFAVFFALRVLEDKEKV